MGRWADCSKTTSGGSITHEHKEEALFAKVTHLLDRSLGTETSIYKFDFGREGLHQGLEYRRATRLDFHHQILN